MKKSRFWTVIFSLFPGVGHFYLGLMQRGLQLSILTAGLIIIISVSNLGAIAALAPVVWFYGIFDALQKAASINQGQMVTDDLFFAWNKLPLNPRWAGWVLIIFGILAFLNSNFGYLGRIPELPYVSFLFHLNYPVLILSIFMIVLGIRILKRYGTVPTQPQ